MRIFVFISTIMFAALAHAASTNWETSTHQQFVGACAGNQARLIAPCRCVITQLTTSMTQEEFVKLSQSGAIENDRRYTQARTTCLDQHTRK